MQPPSVRQIQSMAAAMTKLTRQNQELTWVTNQRRQLYGQCVERQAQS